MSLRATLQNQIAQNQARIAILDSVAEDTFPFGTVAVFASAHGKWHIVKEGEESWKSVSTPTITTRSLSEWVLNTRETSSEYFEIYILDVRPTPFYASA